MPLCVWELRYPGQNHFTAYAARALEAGYGYNDTAILPSSDFSGIYPIMRYFGKPAVGTDLRPTSHMS